MSYKITVHTVNLSAALTMLRYLSPKLREQSKSDLHKFVEDVRDLAKQFCPVDTGSLKMSIRIEIYASPAGVWHKLGVRAGGYITNPKTGRKVDYAVYVEYGTSKMSPQPFMRPAWQAKRASLGNVMGTIARRTVRI